MTKQQAGDGRQHGLAWLGLATWGLGRDEVFCRGDSVVTIRSLCLIRSLYDPPSPISTSASARVAHNTWLPRSATSSPACVPGVPSVPSVPSVPGVPGVPGVPASLASLASPASLGPWRPQRSRSP